MGWVWSSRTGSDNDGPRERPWSSVSPPLKLLLVAALLLQVLWHRSQPAPSVNIEALTPPLDTRLLKVLSGGEALALSRIMMLQLQAYDNQPGVSLPFSRLNYATVIAHLRTALALDHRSQYPLLAASHLYAEVADASKQRQMLDFISTEFMNDPNRRWPWMVHAVHIARHRLHDLPLALSYAQRLAENISSAQIPAWVKQMHIFLLDDMGETESAKALLSALLESGTVSDPNERQFLQQRFDALHRSP